MSASKPKPLVTRHYFPMPESAVATLDAKADAAGLTRGEVIAEMICEASRAVGIDERDAPMHRSGASVHCDPERPYSRLRWWNPNDHEEPFMVYADIDGREGRTFALLMKRWKLGSEECLERIVSNANGGAQ